MSAARLFHSRSLRALAGGVLMSALLSACGGGDSNSSSASSSSTTPTSTLSGIASKGPLDGAVVCAYAIVEGARGAQVGSCTTTDANGNYSLDLGGFAGDVLVEASGGSYIDEATGVSVALTAPLRSVAPEVSGGNFQVAVTALTELATRLAEQQGGLTRPGVAAAMDRVEQEFGVTDIRHTQPADVLQGLGTDDPARRAYGLALANLAQFQKDVGAGSLPNTLERIGACLNDNRQCGTTRMDLSQSRQAFESIHPGLPRTATGSGPACMIRAEENTASACLLGLDAAAKACNADALSDVVRATFVEYFQGALSFTPAQNCDSDTHVHLDVAAHSLTVWDATIHSQESGNVLQFVDQNVLPRLALTLNNPDSAITATTGSSVVWITAMMESSRIYAQGTDSSLSGQPNRASFSNFSGAFQVTRKGSALDPSAITISNGNTVSLGSNSTWTGTTVGGDSCTYCSTSSISTAGSTLLNSSTGGQMTVSTGSNPSSGIGLTGPSVGYFGNPLTIRP